MSEPTIKTVGSVLKWRGAPGSLEMEGLEMIIPWSRVAAEGD